GEAARRAARLVGQGDSLEIADPRLAAVAGADAGEPLAGIEALGGLLALPHIDAARDLAAAGADELLAQEARNLEEIRGDVGEVGAALLEAVGRRQVIEDDGGDHGASLEVDGSSIGKSERGRSTRARTIPSSSRRASPPAACPRASTADATAR